jgi:hypothetical protein
MASKWSRSKKPRRAGFAREVLEVSPGQGKRWSVWPRCLDDIQQSLRLGLKYTFEPSRLASGRTDICETLLKGSFKCTNVKCSGRFWTTGGIATNIQHYSARRQFNVTIEHQKCGRCGKFGRPSLDKHAFIKVASQCLRFWNGLADELPFRAKKFNNKSRHRARLCGGCKKSTCHEGRLVKPEEFDKHDIEFESEDSDGSEDCADFVDPEDFINVQRNLINAFGTGSKKPMNEQKT